MMQPRGALAALALSSALLGCKSKPARLTEQTFELPGGMKVDLVAGPCGDGAEVVVLYAVGTDHDPPGRSGLVHVLGAAGGLADAADHTLAVSRASRAELGRALEAVAARMGRGAPGAADLAPARAAALAELTRRRGGDATLTATSYAAEAVRPTPGDGWRGGIAGEIEAITAAEVESFWQAFLTPVNARLVVVGRFDPTALRTQLEAAFAAVPPGRPPVARPPVQASVTGTLVMGSVPAAVAVAVPAPPPTSPLFPAFLVLAARPTGGALAIDYDPVAAPAILFVTGALQPGEQAEAAAARVRGELAAVLARPLTRDDVAAARARFRTLLGGRALDLAECRRDPRAFAIGRARRAQLGLDGVALGRALDGTTPAQLAEAAALFDARRTAAVVAGGPIR